MKGWIVAVWVPTMGLAGRRCPMRGNAAKEGA